MADINSEEVKQVKAAIDDAFKKAGEKLAAVQDELRETSKEGKATAENLKRTQDALTQAIEESKKLGGVIEGKTADMLKEYGEKNAKLQADLAANAARVLDLEQRTVRGFPGGSTQKSIQELVIESEEWKHCSKLANPRTMDPVTVGSFHLVPLTKTQIVNAAGQNQPLVPSDRLGGIITPAEQRLFVRDIIPATTTTSNLVEFTSEASYTSNARPQGDVSPNGTGEGDLKAESAMTFTLANAPVRTIAHWIPASRQVLSDSSILQGHIGGRLIYGLKLNEETEILTGTATGNTLNGINNQAAAFSYGSTNQTVLDTLLYALLQVSLSNYEASAFILHPTDWFAAILLKDTTGRYLFSDPQSMVAPRVWAKPVVATASQTLGTFTAGAFNLGCQIWDREDATVRVSENVNDYFIRNMVAILAEERLAFTMYRTTAFVTGAVSHAG